MLVRALPVLLVAGLMAGCGNERTRAPDVNRAQAPAGFREARLVGYGIRFQIPRNWRPIGAQGVRAGGIRSGRATVAVWRYPRREELPVTRAELREVSELLVDRIAERDETFDLDRSRLTRRAGAPAIEITGTQTIGGVRARVRSLHAFKHGAEVVVDAYAPPPEFDRVDRTVFRPLLRTLRVRPVK